MPLGRLGDQPNTTARKWVLATACALAVASLIGACGQNVEPEQITYSGYTVDPPTSVAEVALPAADGSGEVSMAAPEGDLRLLYFGYLSCPDVCPTTMSDVKNAVGQLPTKYHNSVHVGLVTVDPDRDSSEDLYAYLDNFVSDGDAFRTEDQDKLRAATGAFGANYEITMKSDEIDVAHTAELYAVDDQGTVVMQWPFGTDSESLAQDLEALLSNPTNQSNESST